MSDHLTGEGCSELIMKVEFNANLVIGDDWRNKIDNLILSCVQQHDIFYKLDDCRTLKSLLRVISNHVSFFDENSKLC